MLLSFNLSVLLQRTVGSALVLVVLLATVPVCVSQAATDGFIALKPLRISPASNTSSWGASKANSLSNVGVTGLRPLSATGTTGTWQPAATTTTSQWKPATASTWKPTANPVSTWQAPQSVASAGLDTSMPTYKSGLSVLGGGEVINIRLNEAVSSQNLHVGDAVTATVESPLIKNGVVALPAGTELSGTVVAVRPAKRVGQHGELDMRFYTATAPNGQRTSLNAVVVTKSGDAVMKGDTYGMDVAKGVGIAVGGTAAGAVVGTAVGGLLSVAGTGAAVGTAVGGAAGVGYALARKGRAVELPKGTYLQVRNLKSEEAPNYQPQY